MLPIDPNFIYPVVALVLYMNVLKESRASIKSLRVTSKRQKAQLEYASDAAKKYLGLSIEQFSFIKSAQGIEKNWADFTRKCILLVLLFATLGMLTLIVSLIVWCISFEYKGFSEVNIFPFCRDHFISAIFQIAFFVSLFFSGLARVGYLMYSKKCTESRVVFEELCVKRLAIKIDKVEKKSEIL